MISDHARGRTNFDRLLERYLQLQLSHAERIRFEVWLGVVNARYKSQLVLTPDDEERLFVVITGTMSTEQDVLNFRPGRRNMGKRKVRHSVETSGRITDPDEGKRRKDFQKDVFDLLDT